MNLLQDIEHSLIKLKSQTANIRAELKLRRLLTAIKNGFDPNQPRDDLGRWGNTTGSTALNQTPDEQVAARGTEAECETQYKLDSAICRIV